MVSVTFPLKHITRYPIQISNQVCLIGRTLVKTILLKADSKKYKTYILKSSLKELLSELSLLCGFDKKKSDLLIDTFLGLHNFVLDSYINEPDVKEFKQLMRDSITLINILAFKYNIFKDFDNHMAMMRDIENLCKTSPVKDIFSSEYKKFIESELMKKKMSIKYPLKIYLDQKDWILLAKAWKEKDGNPILKRLLQKLIIHAYNDKIIIPLSINHMIETSNRGDKKSRDDLIELMITLSKGYTIIPYVTVIPYEIKNAIYQNLGISEKTIEVKKMVFSRGIGNILGATPTIQNKEGSGDEYDKKALERIMYTPEVLRFGFGTHNKKAFQERIKADNALIQNIETNRERFEKQYKDKDLRRRARFATHFVEQINPILCRIIIDEKLPKEEGAKIIGKNPDECTAFMEQMPTSFCSFALTRRRDEQISAPAHEHDLYDIASLSIAIPYCDIVVCEKRFGGFARDEKLDTKYNTLILKNLEELDEYLW